MIIMIDGSAHCVCAPLLNVVRDYEIDALHLSLSRVISCANISFTLVDCFMCGFYTSKLTVLKISAV